MTKKDLIASIAHANPNITKKVATDAVNLFFDMISFYLSHHQRVELRGFGSFSVRKRAAHQAHNPQTGETLFIPEKLTPFFKAGHTLKEDLQVDRKESESKKSGFFTSFYRDLTGRRS